MVAHATTMKPREGDGPYGGDPAAASEGRRGAPHPEDECCDKQDPEAAPPLLPDQPRYTADNLPPHIDAVVEATLVVEDEGECEEDDETDGVDTLGLHGSDRPHEGGVLSDAERSVGGVSALTAPSRYVPMHEVVVRSRPVAEAIEVDSQFIHDASVARVDDERGREGARAPAVLVDAVAVKEGMFHGKGARNAVVVGLALLLVLSIGLAVGFTSGKGRSSNAGVEGNMNNNNPTGTMPTTTPAANDDPSPVLTIATANFCNAAVPIFSELDMAEVWGSGTIPAEWPTPSERLEYPFQFWGNWTTHCADGERTTARGALQQAVADGLYRHFYDDRRAVDATFLPAGAIRGEIAAGPVTLRQIESMLNVPANIDSAQMTAMSDAMGSKLLTYLELTGKDLARLIANAVGEAVASAGGDPWNPLDYMTGEAYPYTGGLNFEVKFANHTLLSVHNMHIYDKELERWMSLEAERIYRVGTISDAFDGTFPYLEGIQPVKLGPWIGPMSLSDALAEYLRSQETWEPPRSASEMSTLSFDNGCITMDC